jgi:iron-sulfur cluster assembly protein
MIQLTDKARQEVREIIAAQNMPAGTFLRVGVAGGGCSGFTYNLRFDTQMNDGDQFEDQDGVRVVCDSKSFVYLEGSEVDFTDGLNGRGFVFRNPNASTTCGCGESFGV